MSCLSDFCHKRTKMTKVRITLKISHTDVICGLCYLKITSPSCNKIATYSVFVCAGHKCLLFSLKHEWCVIRVFKASLMEASRWSSLPLFSCPYIIHLFWPKKKCTTINLAPKRKLILSHVFFFAERKEYEICRAYIFNKNCVTYKRPSHHRAWG